MSFTIKCNVCGSTDVTLAVSEDEYEGLLSIECDNCDNGDEIYL